MPLCAACVREPPPARDFVYTNRFEMCLKGRFDAAECIKCPDVLFKSNNLRPCRNNVPSVLTYISPLGVPPKPLRLTRPRRNANHCQPHKRRGCTSHQALLLTLLHQTLPRSTLLKRHHA